jgi:putative spermidine/putrescine transport system ATP-binding protein
VLGHHVPASRARGMAAGTNVHFLLRPEMIRLEPKAEGMLHGTVISRTFFGALTTLRIDLAGGHHHLTAAMPSAEAAQVTLGSEVSVSWDAGAPRLLVVT